MKTFGVVLFIASLLHPSFSLAENSLHPDHKSYQTKVYKKHAKGLKRTDEGKQKMQAMQYLSFEDSTASVPGSVDLSAQVSLPENQGPCGSCWDFSLTKALRSEFMLQKKDPGVLEFNYLLNNCGPGPRMNGCNGGDFIAAASMVNLYGPGLNKSNPYTARQGSCKRLAVQASAVSYTMLGRKGVGPTFKDLALAVGVQKHMLSIDVAAGMGDWESYSGGVYNDCVGGPRNIDHMIDLVGYSCETSVDAKGNCVFDAEGRPVKGDGYLVVENQWGESWGTRAANGHGGYMKTRMYGRDGNKCNAIATDALMFSLPSPKPSEAPVVEPVSCTGFLCGTLGCWMPWCSDEVKADHE